MKVIKEEIKDNEYQKDVEKNNKEMEKVINPKEIKNQKAFLGAEKQPEPKEPETPKATLDESLFEEDLSNTYDYSAPMGVREYSDQLFDMIEEDLVDAKEIAQDLIYWCSEDDIKRFMEVRDLIYRPEEEDESLKEEKLPITLYCELETYGRYGDGGKRVKIKSSGKDHLEAISKLVDRIRLYIDSEEIEEEEMTFDEVINSIIQSNGDGCDFIFTLKDNLGNTYMDYSDYDEWEDVDESLKETDSFDFNLDFYNAISNVIFKYRDKGLNRDDIENAYAWFDVHFYDSDDNPGVEESLKEDVQDDDFLSLVIEWIMEHEGTDKDFVKHFRIDTVMDPDKEFITPEHLKSVGASLEDVIDWIAEHPMLLDDFENRFNVSVDEAYGNRGSKRWKSLSNKQSKEDKEFEDGLFARVDNELTAESGPYEIKGSGMRRYKKTGLTYDGIEAYAPSQDKLAFVKTVADHFGLGYRDYKVPGNEGTETAWAGVVIIPEDLYEETPEETAARLSK